MGNERERESESELKPLISMNFFIRIQFFAITQLIDFPFLNLFKVFIFYYHGAFLLLYFEEEFNSNFLANTFPTLNKF